MSLNFKLDDNYRISSDPRNYILENLHDVTERETGAIKKVWKDVGYYWSFGHLLERYANEYIRDQDDTSIEELVTVVRELYKHIEELGEELKVEVEKVHNYYDV